MRGFPAREVSTSRPPRSPAEPSRATSPRRRSRAQRAAIFALLAVALAAAAGSTACGTEPVGVDACRKIERVRCESAPACGVDLGRPVHSGDTPAKDVAACIRYYDDQCLHGLVVTKEPSPQDVDACVDAIITGDCSVVKTPESSEACAFLVPPEPVVVAVDAEADADTTSDATAD
ncbi:MAG: hypothetical protein KIS78_26015 [Labilithrix sp.]|nr:hypothetical protein [Labilithrix sp.]